MFGIGTKSARLVATATLALGIGAAGLPAVAEAGDDHRHRGGGHRFQGHHHNPHHHYRHHHGYRHSGVVVHLWNPYPRPVIHHYPVATACHPVVGHGQDAYGRRAKFGGTMCYDRFGNGYVVAGSEHVIHYF